MGLPDIKGREEILKVHAKGKPLAEDVRSGVSWPRAPRASPARIWRTSSTRAALLAARKDQHFITMQDLKDAEIKVIAGPEKKQPGHPASTSGS